MRVATGTFPLGWCATLAAEVWAASWLGMLYSLAPATSPAGCYMRRQCNTHSRKQDDVSPLAAAGKAACAAAAALESQPTAASATWLSCCAPSWLDA